MQRLSDYRSESGVYSASVYLHHKRYHAKTSTGETRVFDTETECENFCEDFVMNSDLVIKNDEETIILKPRGGVL